MGELKGLQTEKMKASTQWGWCWKSPCRYFWIVCSCNALADCGEEDDEEEMPGDLDESQAPGSPGSAPAQLEMQGSGSMMDPRARMGLPPIVQGWMDQMTVTAEDGGYDMTQVA